MSGDAVGKTEIVGHTPQVPQFHGDIIPFSVLMREAVQFGTVNLEVLFVPEFRTTFFCAHSYAH